MAKQKRAKQQHLDAPGMAPPTLPVLDTAAEEFFEARDAWQRLHGPMEAKKEALIQEVHRQIEKGNLKPSPKSDTEVTKIYEFSDSSGTPRILLWGRKEGVKVAKAKRNAQEVELDG